ncbi:MAG: ComF family protein [Proteobacteria bacterium]|nr:ComF family protein [Pseudomonadota bacterium]
MAVEDRELGWRSAWRRRGAELTTALLDLVLPTRCVGCNAVIEAHELLCPACAPALVAVERACRCCGAADAPAPRCGRCEATPPPFGRAWAPWLYGGPLALAIRQLKYGDATYLLRPLGRLLPALDGGTEGSRAAPVLVVPVPLHRDQLVRRGYNQAALLARELARRARAPIDYRALLRVRATRPQVGLGRGARERNVAGAFRACPERVRGRHLVLVDDVITTGATAAACARALRRAGAAAVEVLALARAESPR